MSVLLLVDEARSKTGKAAAVTTAAIAALTLAGGLALGNAAVPAVPALTPTKKAKKKKRKKKEGGGNKAAGDAAGDATANRDGAAGNKVHDADRQNLRNIHEFWQQLSDQERTDLSRVPKDELPKRMKEQQKYTCTCNVCIRRRIVVEEELNTLYGQFLADMVDVQNGGGGPAVEPPPRNGEFSVAHCLGVDGDSLVLTDYVLRDSGANLASMFEVLARQRQDMLSKDELIGGDGPDDVGDMDKDDSEGDDEDLTLGERIMQGKRYFGQFGAKLFEQQIVTAYKEKVALEKQRRLIEEEEREDQAEKQKLKQEEAKKEKRRQKRARQKKNQQEEKRRVEEENRKEEEERAKEVAAQEEIARKQELERLVKQHRQEALRLKEKQAKEEKARVAKEAKEAREKGARELKEKEKALSAAAAKTKAKENARKEQEAKSTKEHAVREKKDKEQQARTASAKESKASKASKDARDKDAGSSRPTKDGKDKRGAQKVGSAASSSGAKMDGSKGKATSPSALKGKQSGPASGSTTLTAAQRVKNGGSGKESPKNRRKNNCSSSPTSASKARDATGSNGNSDKGSADHQQRRGKGSASKPSQEPRQQQQQQQHAVPSTQQSGNHAPASTGYAGAADRHQTQQQHSVAPGTATAAMPGGQSQHAQQPGSYNGRHPASAFNGMHPHRARNGSHSPGMQRHAYTNQPYSTDKPAPKLPPGPEYSFTISTHPTHSPHAPHHAPQPRAHQGHPPPPLGHPQSPAMAGDMAPRQAAQAFAPQPGFSNAAGMNPGAYDGMPMVAPMYEHGQQKSRGPIPRTTSDGFFNSPIFTGEGGNGTVGPHAPNAQPQLSTVSAPTTTSASTTPRPIGSGRRAQRNETAQQLPATTSAPGKLCAVVAHTVAFTFFLSRQPANHQPLGRALTLDNNRSAVKTARSMCVLAKH